MEFMFGLDSACSG